MTEMRELIALFENGGGRLRLDGGQISYSCSDELAEVLDLLVEVKGEVKALLRRRQEAVARWIREFCVGCLAGQSDPRVLYREYAKWATAGPIPYEQFIEALAARGHCLGSDGMTIRPGQNGRNMAALQSAPRDSRLRSSRRIDG